MISMATSTSTATTTTTTVKKNRVYRRKKCLNHDCATTTTIVKKKREYRRKKPLHHDLIMEEILTKVPIRTLFRCAAVSKLWCNSIHNDKRLTHSHFRQSQNHPDFILSILNIRDGVKKYTSRHFKFSNRVYGGDGHHFLQDFECLPFGLDHMNSKGELVGYCNGFPCISLVGYNVSAYSIVSPYRRCYLRIIPPVSVGKRIPNAHIICHGFGFDSLAEEYKVVSIFRTSDVQLNFVVYTLGTKSWRNMTTTTMLMSDHGRPLNILRLRAATSSDKSAIFCSSSGGGCLAWKIVATVGGEEIANDDNQHNNSEMEMLLLFNLHDEKFQFIRLPTSGRTDEQQKPLPVDYPHLLEFKGSPCIARIKKPIAKRGEYFHRRHSHGGTSCCCCCKIHLHVLKDQSEWVKEESFSVRVKKYPHNLSPDPCCFCFGSTTTPPTRILSFSDQIFLYWLSGNDLQVYNLRYDELKLVRPCCTRELAFFHAKTKEPLHIFDADGDGNTSCSNLDYQLHCQGENFLSLQTFIPEGVTGIDRDAFNKLSKGKDSPVSAYAVVHRDAAPEEYYPLVK